MMILHVVPTYFPAVRYGGPIWSVHALCKSLVNLGHEVSVITTNVDGKHTLDVPLGKLQLIDGVKVYYFPTNFPKKIYCSVSMFRYLNDHVKNFDFIHLHSSFLAPTAYAAKIAMKKNIPWCVAPRGALVPEMIRKKSFIVKTLALKTYEKKTLENASFIHATSELEKNLIQKIGLNIRSIEIIPNGIDVPNIDTLLVNSKHQNLQPYILFLGRVSRKKRLDRLIMAMKMLPKTQLIIAGNDDENLITDLLRIAAEANLLSQIEYVGPVYGEEKYRLLKNAQALVLPSENENFGNVVLEALACSCPVAISKHVGLAPVIVNSGCGLVISDDPLEIGMQLADFLSNEANLKIMGDRGLNLVHDEYSWIAIAQKMTNFYAKYQDKMKLI